jgi:hypothetical protein
MPFCPETAYTPMVLKVRCGDGSFEEIATVGFAFSIDELYSKSDSVLFSEDLRIREVEEVEENIALNTLGTIIHETLKVL